MKNINSRVVFFIILSFTSDIHAEVTKLVCNYDDNFTVENYKINLVNKKITRHTSYGENKNITNTVFNITYVDEYHILGEHKFYTGDRYAKGRMPESTYKSMILILRKESIIKGANLYFSLSDLESNDVNSFEVKCNVQF